MLSTNVHRKNDPRNITVGEDLRVLDRNPSELLGVSVKQLV